MGAIPISGINGEEIVGSSSDLRHILETTTGGAPDFNGDGRVFELLHLQVHNSHATSQSLFRLFDSDESTAAPTSLNMGGNLLIPPNTTVEKVWARGTGPRFRTNIVAEVDANSGTVAAGAVYASGLLH